MKKLKPFKIIGAVKFNDGEALVLNRPIQMIYEVDPRDGKSLIGSDGPFRDFLGYGGSGPNWKAFAGRAMQLTMSDGTVQEFKDNWWSSCKDGYVHCTVNDKERLIDCYVFNGANIKPEDFVALRSTYSGTVYDYWDYEKIISHEKWISQWVDENSKVRNLTQEKEAMNDLLRGRAMLMRAVKRLREEETFRLPCTLHDAKLDHIGEWKAAIKEYGADQGGDEYFEVMECPRCSAQYGAFKAKKLMLGLAGRISGNLTRIGNILRREDG